MFNPKHDHAIEPIYGCVTTGKEWLFLRLQGHWLEAHETSLFLSDLPSILGAFEQIMSGFREAVGETA